MQRLLAPDDPTLALLQASDHLMYAISVCVFKQLVWVVEAYIRGYNSFIMTVLAVLKIGRPILVPRQV